MKHFFIVCSIFFTLSEACLAQTNPIPNPGFEEWDSVSAMDGLNDSIFEPINWTMFDGSFQSTNSHSGLYSLGGATPGGGGAEADFHLSFTPSSFEGYYQLVSVQNDFALFLVWVRHHGNLIGTATIFDSITSPGWVHFIVPISYTSSDEPDSAEIHLFGLGSLPDSGTKSFGQAHAGSSFVIDDLSLSASSSVNGSPNNQEFMLTRPNPASELITISYDAPQAGLATFEIFDPLGKKIWSEQKFAAQGNHEESINIHQYPAGVYSYCVNIGDHSNFGHFEIMR